MMFLNQPADLFQSMRSSDSPIQERIHLAQSHWSNPLFKLPHKELYFLRWFFETELYQPKKNPRDGKTAIIPSPVQYPVFWQLLSQLVSNVEPQDLSAVIGGPGSILLIRQTLLDWSNLFEDLELTEDVWKSLQAILPALSQSLSLDLALSFLNLILEGLLKLQRPISQQAERVILLIINAIIPTIELFANSRKAFTSIFMNADVMSNILQVLSSDHITSVVKSAVRLIVKTFTLNVESLKKIQVNKHAKIEWLESLIHVGKDNRKTNSAAIRLATYLMAELIQDIPGLRPQLFNQQLNTNGPGSSTSWKVTVDSSHLHPTRMFILHVFHNVYQVMKDLGESTACNLSDSMTNLKEITGLISKCNLYDPGDPIQHKILDEVAGYCTSHLPHSSRDIVMDSLQILVILLSLDYTLIEARLSAILGSLAAPSYSSPHEVEGPILEFVDGIFNWFSKSKQLPNLIIKWIETIETKLDQNLTLGPILDGPLMARRLLERAHEEIRLSISSAQVALLHDLLVTRYKAVLQNLVFYPSESEPCPKRRKISASRTNSQNQDKSTKDASFNIDDRSANTCNIISFFYELFIVAASRSPTLSREWSRHSQKAYSFASEMIKAVILPILKHWPPSQSVSKNRFRKWKKSAEQVILASVFRIVASVYQVQGLQVFTELEGLDMSEWLELLHQVFKTKKDPLDPRLIFELIHLCLEHTSCKILSFQSVDLNVPHTVYQIFFQLIDAHEGDLKKVAWNGSALSLTSAQLPCALWYHLTTKYLSDFATSATPEQLNRFAEIVIKFGSPPDLLQPCDQSLIDESKGLTLATVNQMMLSAPTFFECTNLREPFLRNLVAGFTNIVSLGDENDGAVVGKFNVSQLEVVNGLFGIIAHVPMSYLTKWTRKHLLNWAMNWNRLLTAQQDTTTLPLVPQLTASEINCRNFFCRLLSDPLYSINPQNLKKVANLATSFLTRSNREISKEPLTQVTEKLISVIILKLMKNIKPGEDSDSSLECFDTFCSALAQRISPVVQKTSKSKSILFQDRLVISALQSVLHYGKMLLDLGKNPNQVSSTSMEEALFFHQRLRKSMEPILNQFEKSFQEIRSKRMLKLSCNLGFSKLGKLYLQLCSLNGNQSRPHICPIDLKLIVKSVDQLNKFSTEEISSSDQPVQQQCELEEKEELIRECMNLFEEYIEINRNRYSNKPKTCVEAFQALLIFHTHLRTSVVSKKFMMIPEMLQRNDYQAEDFLSFKLRKSLVKSCKNSNQAESGQGLLMILRQINSSYSHYVGEGFHNHSDCFDNQQQSSSSNNSKDYLFFRLWILIDVGFLLVLNFPNGHDDPNLLRSDPDIKGFGDEMGLKLLKSFKLLNLDQAAVDQRSKSVMRKIFYSWKIELMGQLCVRVIHKSDGRSIVEIFETMIDLSLESELEIDQMLYDGLISVVGDLNQEFARRMIVNNFHLLIKLLTNLMKPKMDLRNYTRLISDLTSTNSFIPAFSKHAPFLLVKLLEKISLTSSSTSSYLDSINQFIHSALFGLISTIGKFERSSISHLIVELSSSFEEHQSANLLLYWKKILRDWENFRYKGVD